ncbi:MAG TPA: hypothetical protein ACFYD2_08930 [Candidatus Avalokitesvara rifleensis]|uniref:hypothetical protein n=1 Tax=Candidatus Avalokitesvara rifleensis TaxID=3367620 RepID=UPI00271361A5|nr:hypothetical protein [Candidatus Brocadiales bacterium]
MLSKNIPIKQNCKLCGTLAELKESHLVPSFIYRWLKNTSGTGHLRFGQTPNKRVQDGMKIPLLCNDCEQLLSRWENTFAQKIFHPIRDKNDGTLTYGPWFAKFAASVSWRILYIFVEGKYLTHFPPNVTSKINEVLQKWKAFILDKADNPGPFPLSFIPFGILSSMPPPGASPNINWYLTRPVDVDVVYAEGQSHVFSKMCHCVILGFIERPVETHWRGTRLSVKGGTVSQNITVPEPFWDYVNRQAKGVYKLTRDLSQRQKDVISKSYQKNMERFAGSETFKAIDQDFLMFGNKAFPFDANDEPV